MNKRKFRMMMNNLGTTLGFPRYLFGGGELGAWLDPSDLSTMFQDAAGTTPAIVGQPVGKLSDKSGNGLHVTAAGAARPTLRQDAGGRYYLEFDGTGNKLTAAISWTGTALTIATAFNTLTTPGANEFLVGLGNTGNASDYGGLRLTNTTGIADFVAVGGLGTMSAQAESQGVPGDPHVCIGQTTGPTAYRDLTANTGTGSITSLAALNILTIGALTRSVTGNYAGGNFYGAIVINKSVSTTDRLAINSYLRGKFGANGFFSAVGDSHTLNADYSQVLADFYPRKLATLLGGDTISLNYGVSGNTTANMVARIANVTEATVPEFAVIYGSTNDNSGATTVQASPAPTTTAFTVAAGIGARYGAGAHIAVNGASAVVSSVATDRITVTAPLGFTPEAGQAVVINTQQNLVKIGQAYQAIGCSRILVLGLHYYNYASNGDTTTTETVAGAALRAIQRAAANDLGAVYVDLYDWMRDLIVAEEYTQGDDTAWHVGVGNAHLNNTGEQILADAIYAAIQEQGW